MHVLHQSLILEISVFGENNGTATVFICYLSRQFWLSAKHNIWAVRSWHRSGIEAWALCGTQTLGAEELWRNTRQQQAGPGMVAEQVIWLKMLTLFAGSGKAQGVQQIVIILRRWGGGAVSLPNSKGLEIFSFALNRYTILSAWPLVDTNCSCVM